VPVESGSTDRELDGGAAERLGIVVASKSGDDRSLIPPTIGATPMPSGPSMNSQSRKALPAIERYVVDGVTVLYAVSLAILHGGRDNEPAMTARPTGSHLRLVAVLAGSAVVHRSLLNARRTVSEL